MGELPFFAGERTWAEHGARHARLIADALAGGRALQGEPVAALERALAERCGRRHAVAVGSGTDALFFALVAAGVVAGHEVLVPAVSFVASASCVVRAGATPVFVDVDEHGLIDLGRAAAAITPRTRALVVVGLYGQMVEPGAAEALADAHGLALVEDAAQALGARAADRRAGSTGLVGCLSFDPTKVVAAPGSGGALVCDDDALAERARRLRWHGRGADGRFAELGYNSQLPSGAAAVLSDKLGLADGWTARRRSIAAAYDAAAARAAGVRALGTAPGREHVFHKYVVRSDRRDELRATLAAAGVPTLVHYPVPLHRQPLFAGAPAECPRAEELCAQVVSLPIHAYLTDGEVERVCAALATA